MEARLKPDAYTWAAGLFLCPEDEYVRKKYFRHCRYKGRSSTTVSNSYTPPEGEKQLMQAEADYARQVMPNAYYLNDTAKNVLQNSLGTIQVDFDSLNNAAQRQFGNAAGSLSGLTGVNNAAVNTAASSLNNISNQLGQLASTNANRLGSLTTPYKTATDTANMALTNAADSISNTANTTNGILGQVAGNVGSSAASTNSTLGNLANGDVPSAYQQNMADSIASAVKSTMGKTISNLGNRGVLNSSVTTRALNDISKNASDTVAQQYQQNIAQAANLAQQQNANATNASLAQANLAQQADSNATNAAATDAAYGQQALGNTSNYLGNLANLYNTQYSQLGGALTQQGSLAQQNFANQEANSQANAGIYETLMNSAGTPTTLASVAQEAAQSPALRLWQASLGLAGANSSALAGYAGKGTSSQTTRTSGGGSFLGGLLGSALTGAAGAFGAGLWCFPAETRIKMADGTEKKIKSIDPGEMVMGIDKDGNETPVKVTRKLDNIADMTYNVCCRKGHCITTLSQPLMKEDGTFVLVQDLRIGDVLKRVGAVTGVIEAGDRPLYDMQTDGENTYIANGFIAKGGSEKVWRT